MFKYHTERNAEQSWCQNTTLFHAIDDGERFREVAVQPNLAALVFVQLDNHTDELGRWAAQALHDHLPFCSLCRTLWSGPQTLHTLLCSTPGISLGAVWGRTLCPWCLCWLWTNIEFLIDGLKWWRVPICLGTHQQGFFLW